MRKSDTIYLLMVLAFFYNPIKTVGQGSYKKVWLESAGVIVVEAEHNDPSLYNSKNWIRYSSTEGYSGTGYIKFLGPWLGPESEKDYWEESSERQLTYWLKLTEAGRYEINVRNYHLYEDGDNDFWYSVNNADWKKSGNNVQKEWTWNYVGIYELEAGIQKLQISGRSKGFCIDRIVMHRTDFDDQTNNTDENPSYLVFDTIAPKQFGILKKDSLSSTSNSLHLQLNGAADDQYLEGIILSMNGDSPYNNPVVKRAFTIENLIIETNYTFTYRLLDWFGNLSPESEAIDIATHDSERPSSPGNFSIEQVSPKVFNLHWSPSTDNFMLDGYHIYLDEIREGHTYDTSYTIGDLEAAQNYWVYVRAVDKAGNESRRTEKLSISVSTGSVLGEIQEASIFPNPASEKLYLENIPNPSQLDVFSISGQHLISYSMADRDEFDISELLPGIYLLSVRSVSTHEIYRFVKQ